MNINSMIVIWSLIIMTAVYNANDKTKEAKVSNILAIIALFIYFAIDVIIPLLN